MTEPTRQDIADEAAEIVRDALIAIQDSTGTPTDLLLAGAMAQVTAMMAAHLGGPFTAAHLTHIASCIRDKPSLRACSLAHAVPAGRA